jgi:hypothetical protein
MITNGVRDSATPVHSTLREKFDYAGAVHDHQRAAQAGGPRQIARDFGRPRGSDRFPAKRRSRRSKR